MADILCKNPSTNTIDWIGEDNTSGYHKMRKTSSTVCEWQTIDNVAGDYLMKDGTNVSWINKTFGFVITFNYQNATGGNTETSRLIPIGQNIGTLPEPTRTGFFFNGWWTATSGGLPYEANMTVSASITLYARWGTSPGIDWGAAITSFNMQYDGDRTNYNNAEYELYAFRASDNAVINLGTGVGQIQLQAGLSSSNGTNNMTSTNKNIIQYIRATNNTGVAGFFHIGFGADSYCVGNDGVRLQRITKGMEVGPSGSYYYRVEVDMNHNCWMGQYNSRSTNRLVDLAQGTEVGGPSSGQTGYLDTGFSFTIRDIWINVGGSAILEIKFTRR